MNTCFTVSRDGTQIAYEVIGTGQRPLILVDGALCFRGSGPMRPLANELSAEFQVILYDRRGRGESADTPPYGVAREIEDIAALVQVAGGSAFLLGISSGAILAVKAAEALGDQVLGLVVYEPPLVTDAQRQQETLEFTQTVDTFLQEGNRDAAATAFMMRVMKTLGYPVEAVAGMKGSPMWDGILALAPTIGYDNRVMGNGQVPPEAQKLTIPSLVLYGSESPEAMRQSAELLASTIPGAEIDVLWGQSHDVKTSVLASRVSQTWRPKGL